MAKQAKRQLAGSGEALPVGVIGSLTNTTWSGVTITTGSTTLGTISSVNPGVYLVMIETDATASASTARVTSNFTGTATFSLNRASVGGDFVVGKEANTVILYVTYYLTVTAAGTFIFSATAIAANATGCRGSMSLVRLA
jgi:hypothetical protein